MRLCPLSCAYVNTWIVPSSAAASSSQFCSRKGRQSFPRLRPAFTRAFLFHLFFPPLTLICICTKSLFRVVVCFSGQRMATDCLAADSVQPDFRIPMPWPLSDTVASISSLPLFARTIFLFQVGCRSFCCLSFSRTALVATGACLAFFNSFPCRPLSRRTF